MRNILIIGGTGFIGGHLVEALQNSGYQVAVLVRKDSKIEFLRSLGVELRLADIEDLDSLKEALVGIDTVFSAVNVKPEAKSKAEYEQELLKLHRQGTENLITASEVNRIKRLIYFSSVSAIGYQPDLSHYDEGSRCNPVDAYGRAKLAAEDILNQAVKDKRLDITILRPPGVFGERGLGPLAKIIFFIKKGVIPVIGSGKNKQSFAYVGNLVNQAIFLAENQGAIGKTYITSDKNPYTVNELVDTVSKLMAKRVIKMRIPAWLIMKAAKLFNQENIIAIGGQRIFDSRKIFALGYKEKYNLEVGIRRTLDWCNKNV